MVALVPPIATFPPVALDATVLAVMLLVAPPVVVDATVETVV